MVISKNSRVIAASLTLKGIKSFEKVKAAMPLVGSIVQAEIRSLTPHITGTLKRSVSYRFYEEGKWKIILENYSSVYYAPFVEYGTYKMSPRRMFARGSEAAHPKIEQYLKGIGAL